jgi:putative ABC transport system permease protein
MMAGLSILRWNIALAIDALQVNRARSALAVLGVTIGIASVIVMGAIGEGLSRQISGDVEALGSNVVFVFPDRRDETAKAGRSGRLTTADVRALTDGSPSGIVAVSGQLRGRVVAQVSRSAEPVDVIGVDEAYRRVVNINLKTGRGLSDQDISRAAMNIVIDSALEDRLFSGSGLGQRLNLDERPYTVVGVVTAQAGAAGSSVIIPVSTMRSRIPNVAQFPGELGALYVRIEDSLDSAEGSARVEAVLKEVRRISDEDPLPLQITSSAEFVRQSQTILRALQAGLIGIAGVSLLVGAIGVMNVMLVAVTERRREIGVRLAIGAAPSDILKQFLTESAILCLIGGGFGVTLGMAFSALLALISGWSTWPTAASVVMALTVSILVGMVAGYVPARSAARLPPVVAIREE